MRRVAAGILVALVIVVVPAGGAPAPPTGWDGSNPFRCELQQAGFGTDVPHPDADPYCVEFDKRQQNVTELGVVDFLSKEPARVAAAVPKCFYFQSDHWRGSIVQDDGSTKTYEWDGHYYFDKARGEGGAWVTNFNVNGRTYDPSSIPGMPPEYARYMGPGTGGVTTRNDIQGDPNCVARAQQDGASIYASAAVAAKGAGSGCPVVTGPVSRRQLGKIALGDSESRVHATLGEPAAMRRGFLRYCVQGGGAYRVGQVDDRSGDPGAAGGGPTVMLLTTAPGLSVRGVGRGAGFARVRKAFLRQRRVAILGRTRVYETKRHSGMLVGVRAGHVRFLAVYDRRAIRGNSALRGFLRRAQ